MRGGLQSQSPPWVRHYIHNAIRTHRLFAEPYTHVLVAVYVKLITSHNILQYNIKKEFLREIILRFLRKPSGELRSQTISIFFWYIYTRFSPILYESTVPNKFPKLCVKSIIRTYYFLLHYEIPTKRICTICRHIICQFLLQHKNE